MAKKTGPKTHALRLYLIKKNVKKYDDALKDPSVLSSFSLKTSVGHPGKLYLRAAQPQPVEWLGFLQAGVKGTLPPLTNNPNAAVLFLEVDNRTFAFVFGYGKSLLDDRAYETDFGLRSTLNSVNPGTLRSIDVYSHEAVTIHKRIQTSLSSSLSAFSLDMHRERVRSLTGVAKDSKLASRVSGTEGGFGVSTDVDFAGLAAKCKAYLKVYLSSEYKTAFPAFDYFRSVTDPVLLDTLNNKLLALLRKKKTAEVHLSPPEPIDYADFGGFSFSEKGDIYPDMSLQVYLKRQKNLPTLVIDDVKRHRVFLRTENVGGEPLETWSVFRALVCEVGHSGSLYVLSAGEWHQVSLKFAGQVHDYVKSIPESPLVFPASNTHKIEADYLAHVCSTNPDYAFMDQHFAWCDSAGSKMEVCDLFSKNKQFIHAKRKCHGASGFSHLFMQGRNSAIAFVRDQQFRAETKNHLNAAGAHFASLIPDTRPEPSQYEVVYVFMGKKDVDFFKALPFLSKLSFMKAAEDLRAMGFKLSYKQAETPV